jgi:hypothetical protein
MKENININMINWNYRTPKQFFASCIWNLSEYFEIGLGKYAPIIFGWMIGAKQHMIK